MLIAQQRSALSGFSYDLTAPDGSVIGELCFPDWAEARNARLKNPAPGRLSSRIDLRRAGQAPGLIHEPDAFTIRRRLCAELPADIPPARRSTEGGRWATRSDASPTPSASAASPPWAGC